jgi:hypothetical protein
MVAAVLTCADLTPYGVPDYRSQRKVAGFHIVEECLYEDARLTVVYIGTLEIKEFAHM